MKKKGLILLLAAALGLVACGGSGEKTTTAAPTTVASTEASTAAPTEAPTETTTEAPTKAQTETPTEADKNVPLSYTSGDGNILAFTGGGLVQDYEGKPAVVLIFNYTNNSSEATSAILDFGIKVFQDGVECSTAILASASEEINNSMKDVKTGVTIPVAFAYSLSNITSDLELEVSDLFDISGNKATQIIHISNDTTGNTPQETEGQAETQAASEGVINYTDNEGSTVVYAKHEVVKDYQGNPMLVVYFDYTNNSDAAKAAMTTYMVKAFQNGIECGIGMSTTPPEEYQNSLKEIKKGTTLSVCWQFSLSDDSDVEIEVGPIFGGAAAKQTISLK